MSIPIYLMTILLVCSLTMGSQMCQCQCCQYMGPLYPNGRGVCPCILKNITTPFTCGGGGSISSNSARLCASKYRLIYDANRPNLCCRLTSVK
jgi:hypothetical protein